MRARGAGDSERLGGVTASSFLQTANVVGAVNASSSTIDAARLSSSVALEDAAKPAP